MAHIVNDVTVESQAKLGNFILPATLVTKTLNGNRNLTVADNSAIVASGNVSGFTIDLPNATTLQQGQYYHIYNSSTTTLQVRYNDHTTALGLLAQNSVGYFYLEDGTTTNGVWRVHQTFTDAGVASGIVNYTIASSTAFSTTSATPVVITGFTITPQAGTYAIWFNARMQNSSGSPTNNWSIFKDGVEVTDSLRGARFGAASTDYGVSTQTITQVTGVQAIDVRVRCTGSTLTTYDRSMILIRLGN